jgi:hypothetical protein
MPTLDELLQIAKLERAAAKCSRACAGYISLSTQHQVMTTALFLKVTMRALFSTEMASIML